MKTYKSPLCSCIFCKKTLSSKGIHSHYSVAHTVKGAARQKQSCKTGGAAGGNSSRIRKITAKASYNLNPNKCNHCNTPIPYELKKNKFCNHSCAASTTNKTRIIDSHKKYIYPKKMCRVSFCFNCNTIVRHKRVKYCVPCLKLFRQKFGSYIAKKHSIGGVRPSKQILYNGVMLGSTYELSVAQSLDKHNVQWTKCKKFPYTDPFNKDRTYEPDFYLPEYNVYLDPKNDFLINNNNPALGFPDTTKIQIVHETHNIQIIILDKHQLNWHEIHQLVVSDSNGYNPFCKNGG